MASMRLFHRAVSPLESALCAGLNAREVAPLTSAAPSCAAGSVALDSDSVNPTVRRRGHSKARGALLNVTHDDDEWAGASDGRNHFSDGRFLMFWLESEKNGEYSNFYIADVYFPCAEFHHQLQPLLAREKPWSGLAEFCCSEALMFTIKLDLLITWATAKYTAADPACRELTRRVQDAVVKLMDETHGDSIKEASRVQSDLIHAFNQEVWFTDVQAYVQYVIVWSKFRGSNNNRLLDQLEAIPQGTVLLEASPWDKIYGACPDESYDCFQRDEGCCDPPHREGRPVGMHKAFLQLLQVKFGDDGLRFGPKNGLGLNYLGIAVERVRFHAGAQWPSLRGLLGADGRPTAAHPQYKEFREFLASRIA